MPESIVFVISMMSSQRQVLMVLLGMMRKIMMDKLVLFVFMNVMKSWLFMEMFQRMIIYCMLMMVKDMMRRLVMFNGVMNFMMLIVMVIMDVFMVVIYILWHVMMLKRVSKVMIFVRLRSIVVFIISLLLVNTRVLEPREVLSMILFIMDISMMNLYWMLYQRMTLFMQMRSFKMIIIEIV